MLTKLKGLANKIKQKNQKAKEIQQQEDGAKKTINQIKYFFFSIGIMAPIVGWGVILIVSLMMLAGPVMLLTQFINGIVDEVKEFGASLGNLFTSGCFGTDEECLQKVQAEREINFAERIKEVGSVYKANTGNGMTKDYITKYEGTLVSSGSYSVAIDVPLLVSALNYMDETEENYFQMKQEEMACSRLIKMGMLDEDNNSCANETGDENEALKWYVQPLSSEEKETGIVDPETTISDQIGYDFDVIWGYVTGAGTSNTDPDQCGNYNQIYKEKIEQGIGVVYKDGENIFEKFVKWLSGDNKTSQLRMLAKNMVKMELSSSCHTESTEHDDGTVTYHRSIVNTVSFYNDKDTFKKYLVEEHVPALLLEEYLFYQIEINRKRYEEETGIVVSTQSQEKIYLNWLDTNGILAEAKDQYLSSTETEKYKNQVEKHAETIFEMAEMYEEYMPTYTGGVTCSYAPDSEGSVGGTTSTGIQVQLLTCGSTSSNQVKKGDLIDFEKYIKGVVYAEIDTSYPAEAIKAQAIAARTYALTRQHGMCPSNPDGCWLGYNASTNIVTLRSCDKDQVYCDTETGCIRDYPSGNEYYQGSLSGYSQWKATLTGERKETFYSIIDSTAGMTVVDSNGNNIKTGYVSGTQRKWKSLAESGLDFNEILINTYGQGASLSGGCYFGEALEWKQCGAEWSNISLGGSSSVCRIGCLVTSVAIQIARSGTTLNVDSFDPGVLVTTLNANGGFVNGGNFTWNGWQSIAPNFVLDAKVTVYATSMTQLANQLSGYLNQGYYPVMEVKDPIGQHWVAITGVEADGTITMADPARNVNILSTQVYPAIINNSHTVALFKAR